jgi:hypothetical protein
MQRLADGIRFYSYSGGRARARMSGRMSGRWPAPGWISSIEAMRRLEPLSSDRIRVVAYELRGTRRSHRPALRERQLPIMIRTY